TAAAVVVHVPDSATGADGDEPIKRPRRNSKKPSKFLDYVPPLENKPRGEKCIPIPPKSAVWVLHPDHPGKTIALARAGPHWRSYKKGSVPKGSVPNIKGVSWEYGMQQVTLEHIYPEFTQTKVMYDSQQRDRILTVSDAVNGEFAEDATVLWSTRYLNFVEVSKVK
ncbi:hypothetical protein M758_9G167300, partial [Ceratodon purpureus]